MVANPKDGMNTSNEGAAGADSLEIARLKARNAELETALQASVASHQSDIGALAQVSIPAALQKVEDRVPVQFRRAYTHAGVVGPGKLWAMAPYDCDRGEILLLPKREAERLAKEEPDAVHVDPSKFEDRIVERRVEGQDRNGRRQMQTVEEKTTVKELRERARPAGGCRLM